MPHRRDAAPQGTGGTLGAERQAWRETVPACLVVGGAILILASAQGGYFPTSWGWASTAFLWIVGLWAVASGRSEAGRLDIAFIGLLVLLASWTGLSIVWSVAPSLSVLELQRALVLVSGVAAFLLLARKAHLVWLAGIALLAVFLVSAYALATRLFPDRLGSYDPIAVYRLSEPVGYWNGLGIFSAMGLIVAVGLVADGTNAKARALSAASTVILAATLYFTYSRGAWLALAAGLGMALLTSPRRLRLLTSMTLVAIPAGIGVLVASRSYALTHRVSQLERAADEGTQLALVLLLLCASAAAGAALLHLADRRIVVPRSVRMSFGATIAILALVASGVLIARTGSPMSLAERAWKSFEAPPPAVSTDLNRRLLSFSGNGRVELWRAAADVHREHRLVGSGAGTFERLWRARDDSSQRVRDAHGLYVETLAELGPLGLAMLLAALATPLVGALLARRTRFVPAIGGAYVAFLLHAGVDWDWELAGVTLTALLLGCALVVASRPGTTGFLPPWTRVALGAIVAVASLGAIIGGLGNSALARAQSAVERRDVQEALIEADRARQLMPWSGRPWIARGEAELAAGDLRAAARSFRRAIEIDDRDWRAWLDLAIATEGPVRARALSRARALYPKSTEIARVARQLAAG